MSAHDALIEHTVLALAASRRGPAPVCFAAAAQTLAAQGRDVCWRGLVPALRGAARRLAAEGRVIAYHGAAQVGAHEMRGAYGLGLPSWE